MRLRGCNLPRLGDIYIMTRSRLGACLGAAVAGYCCCSFSGAILSTHKKVHLKEIFSIFFVLFRWNKSKTAKKNCSTLMLELKCASYQHSPAKDWSLRLSFELFSCDDQPTNVSNVAVLPSVRRIIV